MRFLLTVLCLAVFACCSGQEPMEKRVDSVLVSVNGKPICLMDVVNETRPEEARLSYLHKGNQLYEAVRSLRMKTLDEIIKRYLILDDYAKNPYPIPVQLVESMLDDLAVNFGCRSRAELAVKAKESGTTVDDLKRKARERLIIQSMINGYCYRNIQLTPRDIHEYYQANKDGFTQPAKVRLAVIYLKKDRADLERCRRDIEEKLKQSAENFVPMARLYTEGPGPDKGGDLGWVEEKGLRPEFREALAALEPGGVSEPLITDEGCYFLRLTGREAETVLDFKIAGPRLYKEIEAKMREDAIKQYVETLKKDAVIRYGD
jgi:peptidyl-prolyl cis-trans isomerase SurA